jgi:hypothetical protein
MKRVLGNVAMLMAVPMVVAAVLLGVFVTRWLFLELTVPSVLPLDLLAKTAEFRIGGAVVRLPLVAISWAGRSNAQALCEKGTCVVPLQNIASRMQEGIEPVSVVELSIRFDGLGEQYDSYREKFVLVPELCPMLEQRWAREICANSMYRLGHGWLRSFDLVDSALLREGRYRGAQVGGAATSSADAVNAVLETKDFPRRFCGLDSAGNRLSLCVAAHVLPDDVIAVWIVTWFGGQAEVERDARMIEALFLHGFGEREDFQFLQGVAQSLRKDNLLGGQGGVGEQRPAPTPRRRRYRATGSPSDRSPTRCASDWDCRIGRRSSAEGVRP